jgi:hypothetical protein
MAIKFRGIFILFLFAAFFCLRLFVFNENYFIPGPEVIALDFNLQGYLFVSGIAWGFAAVWMVVVYFKHGIVGLMSGFLLLPMMLFGSISWPVIMVFLLLIMIAGNYKNWALLSGLVLVTMLSLFLVVKIDKSALSYFSGLKPAVIGPEINLRMGQEFSKMGENILPLPVRRIVMNKIYLPFFYLERRIVSVLDLEAWFFSYNMQQNILWSEGLIEKQVFGGFDFVILILILMGIVYGKRVNKKLALVSFLLIMSLGFLLGKNWMNVLFLLSLPVFFNILVEGVKFISKKKFIFILFMFLGIISVFTRINLLTNHQMIWLDNRVIAYKFITDQIKTVDGSYKITVSSMFGPAKESVAFFGDNKLADKKIKFGSLPLSSVSEWPEGIYIGLSGEFPRIEYIDSYKNIEILAELHLRDKLAQGKGDDVLVVRKINEK